MASESIAKFITDFDRFRKESSTRQILVDLVMNSRGVTTANGDVVARWQEDDGTIYRLTHTDKITPDYPPTYALFKDNKDGSWQQFGFGSLSPEITVMGGRASGADIGQVVLHQMVIDALLSGIIPAKDAE